MKYKFLSLVQIFNAIFSEYRKDLIIAAKSDFNLGVVRVWFADFFSTSVPFEWFDASPGSYPNFEKVEPIDWGNTLALGNYEVSPDKIRHWMIPNWRRTYNA